MAYDTNLFRLPDPNTVPPGPGFTAVGVSNNSPGTIHNLNTGASISVRFEGSFWTFSITYPEMYSDEANSIIPLLHSLSGGFETIYVQLPQFIYPQNGPIPVSHAGNLSLDPNRADAVIVTSWSTLGIELLPGDMIKFTDSHKVYQIIKTEDTGVDNKRLILHDYIIDKSSIITSGFETGGLLFRVRMEGSITPELGNKGTYPGFTVKFRENIL